MLDKTLNGVAETIDKRLEAFFLELTGGTSSQTFGTKVDSPIFDEVRSLTLRGGKRIRAALLLHGALLFDRTAGKQTAVIDAAAAIELLHAYFLIHDDIMDGDEVRRGGPAVHISLSAKLGDPALGSALGILAGDLASSLAMLMLSRLRLDATRHMRVIRLFSEMHVDVIQGQAFDLLGHEAACAVAKHKTASYTTIGPLAIGAVLGGASDKEVEHVSAIAVPLGVAFQLRDDLIGAFGDPKVTGKPVGRDLKKGKKNLLVEEAQKRANALERQIIENVFERDGATAEEIALAYQAIKQCGAQEACRERIALLTNEFINELEKSPYGDEGKLFLIEVARYLAERER